MDTGKEKHLHFLSPPLVPHQDHINCMVTSSNYTQDCIKINNFQTYLPPTFLLFSPKIFIFPEAQHFTDYYKF